jgi:hypothetical protein
MTGFGQLPSQLLTNLSAMYSEFQSHTHPWNLLSLPPPWSHAQEPQYTRVAEQRWAVSPGGLRGAAATPTTITTTTTEQPHCVWVPVTVPILFEKGSRYIAQLASSLWVRVPLLAQPQPPGMLYCAWPSPLLAWTTFYFSKHIHIYLCFWSSTSLQMRTSGQRGQRSCPRQVTTQCQTGTSQRNVSTFHTLICYPFNTQLTKMPSLWFPSNFVQHCNFCAL